MRPTHPSTDDDARWQQAQEEQLQQQQQRRQRERRLALGAAVLLFFVFLFTPLLFGGGLFGLKSCNAQKVPVWIYNTQPSETELRLKVPAPLGYEEHVLVEAQGIQRIFFSTGERHLQWTSAEGKTYEKAFRIEGPTIITTGSDTCYAIFDMTAFYRGEDDPDIQLIGRIPAKTVVYTSPADTLVVPRQAMPRSASGSVHWVEDFDCSMLAPELEGELLLRARIKLEQREQELQDSDSRSP